MIHIEYRGLGGSYTNLFKEKIKIVGRVRGINFSSGNSPINSFKVACTPMNGNPLTLDQMKEILRHKDITFFIGDSAGLSSEIINSSDMIVSVSHYYSMSHQLQAATVIEEIEQCVTQYVEPVVVPVEKPVIVEPEPQIQLIENIEDTFQNNIVDENILFDDETLSKICDEDGENKIAPKAIAGSSRRIDNKIVEKFISEIGRNGMPVKEIEEFSKSMEDGTSQDELMQKWIDIGGTVPEQVEKVIKPKQDEPKLDIVKKKRGRPRKENPVQVVSKFIAENLPVTETTEKKKRGRPAGSKNKSKVPVDNFEPVASQEEQEIQEETFISVDTEANNLVCKDVEQSTGMRKIGYYVPEKLISDINSVCDMFSITKSYFCIEALTTYLDKNLKVKPNQEVEVLDKKFFTDEISTQLWNQLSRYCADNNLNGYTRVIETAFENYICELND